MRRTKPAKKRDRAREIRERAAERAVLEVMSLWERATTEGTDKDGGERDLERGPEDERVVAGEKVITFVDKVFGGRAVVVVRNVDGQNLHYPLGRVADCETRGSLAKGLFALKEATTVPTAAIPAGVWRNDQNGWVTAPIAALTEADAIEQLVLTFQRSEQQAEPPKHRSSTRQAPHNEKIAKPKDRRTAKR